jgi:hypothetical protein
MKLPAVLSSDPGAYADTTVSLRLLRKTSGACDVSPPRD